MDQVAAVLRVNGRLPRRAVLLADGALGERAQHPQNAEVELLSRLCEISRTATGLASYPRRTEQLLEQALASNSAEAWSAIKDDLGTGDLDLESATAVLRCNANASALAACLVGARDSNHMVHVALLTSHVLDRLNSESKTELGRALACQLRSVMDAFITHSAFLSRDVRDGVLTGFGRLLAEVALPDATVADLVAYALDRRRDELLRLFLHCSPGFCCLRPELVGALLQRARSLPHASRYPVVALLARAVAHKPDALRGHEHEAAQVAREALGDSNSEHDARSCLAAAALVAAAASRLPPDPALVEALASALGSCAASLLSA